MEEFFLKNSMPSAASFFGHLTSDVPTGVTFPVMDKIDVNGPKEHPLYTSLKTAQVKELNVQLMCIAFAE
jgi:glutathione peroxidase-family protein